MKFSIGFSHKKGQVRYKNANLKNKKNINILIFFVSNLFFIKNSMKKNKINNIPTQKATILELIARAANMDNKNAL